MYEIMHRKKQFRICVKFISQYSKRQSLLSDLSNLCKLVKSAVPDGKLFQVAEVSCLNLTGKV